MDQTNETENESNDINEKSNKINTNILDNDFSIFALVGWTTSQGKKEEDGEETEEEQGEEIVAFVPKYGIEARVKVSKEFNARQNMFGKLKVKIEIMKLNFLKKLSITRI